LFEEILSYFLLKIIMVLNEVYKSSFRYVFKDNEPDVLQVSLISNDLSINTVIINLNYVGMLQSIESCQLIYKYIFGFWSTCEKFRLEYLNGTLILARLSCKVNSRGSSLSKETQ